MPQTRTLPTTASPLVLVVLLWGLLWGIGAQQLEPVGPGAADLDGEVAGVVAADVWRQSWSQRYPGCVALALWPHDERPVAVVTRRPDGDIARTTPEDAARADQRVVGACR